MAASPFAQIASSPHRVLVDLQLQRNTCEYKQLQQHTREYVSGIFAQVYALLEIYAEVDGE